MTFEECVDNYDVAIYYHDGKNKLDKHCNIQQGWYWAVECGYQAFDAHNPSATAGEAEAELREWLKTWEGSTK